MNPSNFPSPTVLEEEFSAREQSQRRTGFEGVGANEGPLDLSKEALWLVCGLLLCACMIIGCACCSLRFTKMQQRRRIELEDVEATAADGVRPKFFSCQSSGVNGSGGVSGAGGGGSFGAASIGADISCEFDDSLDLTSTSAK